MSTAAVTTTTTRRAPRPAAAPERERHLRSVPRANVRRAPRLIHGVVGLVGLGVIIVAQLGVSIALSDGAYQLSGLQSQSATLARSEQSLGEQLEVLSSPQNLAMSAESLGMATGVASEYLRLSDGAVLGGPDALHTVAPATGASGALTVGNDLVLSPEQLAVQQAAAQEAAMANPTLAATGAQYPGLLLPAGVAPAAPVDPAVAAAEAAAAAAAAEAAATATVQG